MRFKKGFTLIELLVVIAIIGIISATVVVALNKAKMKSRDARMIADLDQIKKLAELYYLNTGEYTGIGECYMFGNTANDCQDSWATTSPDVDKSKEKMLSLIEDVAMRQVAQKNRQTDPIKEYLGVFLRARSNSYVIFAPVPSETRSSSVETKYYCIDSSGTTKTYSTYKIGRASCRERV